MGKLDGGMKRTTQRVVVAIAILVAGVRAEAQADSPPHGSYAKWEHGLPADSNYFPIAVWLQAPRNAERFRKIGINLFVGLWEGPTAGQLAALKAAMMPVICNQNTVGLSDPNRDIIVGWMHGDEPDNAQELPGGKGYGPPVAPQKIVADYRRIAAADPTRPVLLNLGQGVAWDGYHGRGVRTRHPEDYAAYLEGCDIASFDIYPVTHDRAEVAGKLEFVAHGVDRLREWSGGRRIVWNCIECTRISSVKVKPTPEQVRSVVWMSLIHGSRGLIYFVHQFQPKFIEAGLLADAEMAGAVGGINRQIRELAPVLNSPTVSNEVRVSTEDAEGRIDTMVKRAGDTAWLFAVNMRNKPAAVTFQFSSINASEAAVLGEDRKLGISAGKMRDQFAPYAVHLYRLHP